MTPRRFDTMKSGFVLYVLPTLLYVGALFWLGAVRMTVDVPHAFVPEDKLKHFVAFGLLVFLLYRTLRFQWPAQALGRLLILSIAGSSAIGALLEAWQCLFPYRSSEFADWVADTFGALLAGSITLVWQRRRRNRTTPEAVNSSTQMQ